MRRLASALVLAALTFTLLLAGTGAAAAENEGGPLDGTFQVPPSQPGDRGVYALNLVVDMGEMMDALASMYGSEIDAEDQAAMAGLSGTQVIDAEARWEVERLPDRLLPLPGGLEPVASFASTWGADEVDWSGSWASTDYDYGYNPCVEDPEDCGGDGFGASASSSWGSGGDEIAGEPWHVVHVDSSHSVVATTRVEADASLPGALLAKDLGLEPGLTVVTRPGPGTAPCGFHSTLQDGPQPLSTPIRVDGLCPPPGGTFDDLPQAIKSNRFLAVGHDLVAGRETIVYAQVDDPESMRLWFTADVAYPVRMLLPLEVMGQPMGMHLLYELTEFHQGTLEPLAGLPPLAIVPRTVTGPDAADAAHPFPLADALLAAKADQQDNGTARFLAAHPDAAVDQARFIHIRDGDNPRERWAFSLVAGGDALDVEVTKGEAQPVPATGDPLPVDPGSLLPPGILPGGPTVPTDDGVVVRTKEGSSTGHASLAQMPATTPRVADLLSAWQRDGGAGGTPSWGFRFATDGSTWIAAGQAEASLVRGNSGDVGYEGLVASFLGVGADGRFLFMEESPARYDVPGEQDPDEMGPGYDTSQDGTFSDPRSFKMASVGFWTFPEGKTTTAVSVGATLVGILAYILLPAKFGLGLFSRIGNDEVLEHPMRAQITDLVAAEPGIHFQELVRRLDAGRGTTEHHLRKLMRANVITSQVSQGFTCYFPKGKVDRHLMAAAPALKSDGARQVLQAIQQQPGRAALDVAEATGLTPSTVNYHLKRLAASGLVSNQRQGRFILLTPTPLGTQALGAWGRT